MFLGWLAKMFTASWLWHLIYLMPSLASSWVLNFLSQHYGKVIEEFMLQGQLGDWLHPLMSVKGKLQLKRTCSLPPGGYLDISKMQTAKNAFISGEIWVTFNYVCISLLLWDARTVKCYKKTHLAHNMGCNNSKKGYEMRFSSEIFTDWHLIAWHVFIKYCFISQSINLVYFPEILSIVYRNSTNA